MKKTILPTEIALRFHPSKFLWGWWLLFTMAVVTSLWLTLPPGWALGGIFLYGLACLWQWTQLVATTWYFSVQSLHVDVYGHMTITNTLRQCWQVKVLPDSVVHHACMVLHIAYLDLKPDQSAEGHSGLRLMWKCLRPTRLLILFDQADAESQKALRVWLKWGLH